MFHVGIVFVSGMALAAGLFASPMPIMFFLRGSTAASALRLSFAQFSPSLRFLLGHVVEPTSCWNARH